MVYSNTNWIKKNLKYFGSSQTNPLFVFTQVEHNLMCLCKVDCISLLVKRSFQDKIMKIGYVCGILDLTYKSDF